MVGDDPLLEALEAVLGGRAEHDDVQRGLGLAGVVLAGELEQVEHLRERLVLRLVGVEVEEVSHERHVQLPLGLHEEVLLLCLGVARRVLHQQVDDLHDRGGVLEVEQRVVVHRLVDLVGLGVDDLELVAVAQEEVAVLLERVALGVGRHDRAVELEQVGADEVEGLARAGAAEHVDVLVALERGSGIFDIWSSARRTG